MPDQICLTLELVWKWTQCGNESDVGMTPILQWNRKFAVGIAPNSLESGPSDPPFSSVNQGIFATFAYKERSFLLGFGQGPSAIESRLFHTT